MTNRPPTVVVEGEVANESNWDIRMKTENITIIQARQIAAAVEAMARALVESAEDTARLDWIQKQKYGCWGINTEPISRDWVYVIESGGNSDSGRTIRAAIDAARKLENPDAE